MLAITPIADATAGAVATIAPTAAISTATLPAATLPTATLPAASVTAGNAIATVVTPGASTTASLVPAGVTETTTPSCQQASQICEFIFDQTKQAWLAESSYYLLVKPFQIAMIVLAAVIIRHLLHSAINRLIRERDNGTPPGMLRPLRERMPVSFQEVTGLRSERRRQRAMALGSVLRSVASATVFAVSALLILGELGLDLAPLLASAGVAGVAVGFGAQNLVKDFIAGLFMLLEDQYGVGDNVDLGEASGIVESVGLRVTTIRDGRGVLWYIRNGEIIRVGNRSQGWAMVVVDVPVGFAGVEEASAVLRAAAIRLAEDPEFEDALLETPEVLGVEQITVDGAVLRTTVKTSSESQWQVARELRRRLTEALEAAGIAQQISAGRGFVRPAAPGDSLIPPTEPGVGGPT